MNTTIPSSVSTIILGADHAGYTLKQQLVEQLKQHTDLTVVDLGCDSADVSVSYPEFAHNVAQKVLSTPNALGVLVCGSGVGVCIAANRHADIRAALCHTEELAGLAREHNNANILCMGARVVDETTAKAMLTAFLTTPFAGDRHAERVNAIELSAASCSVC